MSRGDLDKERARSAKWRAANRELAVSRSLASRRKNDRHKTYMAKVNRDSVEGLTDSYVAKQLGVPVASAPPGLIEMKRELIRLRRLTRQLSQELTTQPEKENGN